MLLQYGLILSFSYIKIFSKTIQCHNKKVHFQSLIPFYYIVPASCCILTLFFPILFSFCDHFLPPVIFSPVHLLIFSVYAPLPTRFIPPGSLICISLPTSSPFSLLQHPWRPLSTPLFLTLLQLYLFLSWPFSIHPWIPCLLRHWIPCLLRHFCLFLCFCLTSYSLLMYLSHFQKQCCQSFPRELK